MPPRLTKERRDVTPVTFDFSQLFDTIDSYTIDGDMPIVSDSTDGTTVTVVLDAGQADRLYDLAVVAVSGNETRAATVQVNVEDRERGYNSLHGSGYWWCGGYW